MDDERDLIAAILDFSIEERDENGEVTPTGLALIKETRRRLAMAQKKKKQMGASAEKPVD